MTNQQFADFTTSQAFSLTLSKHMIVAMVSVANDKFDTAAKYRYALGSDRSVPSLRALCERGLVVHHDSSEMNPPWSQFPYSLTKEGELVFELLKSSGLINEQPKELELEPANAQ